MRNTTVKWLEEMKGKIEVGEGILDVSHPIRGIYGIFVIKGGKEYCAYIGRASDIYGRLFRGASAHLVQLKDGLYKNEKINGAMEEIKKQIEIKEEIKEEVKIEVKVLEEVKCEYKYENLTKEESYNRDMQKLASRESYYINQYQENGQCLEQRPDGSNMKQKVWEEGLKLKKGELEGRV